MSDAPTTKQYAKGVSNAVYRYLTEHRNIELHADDIAAAVGFTKSQVTSAVNNLRSNGSTITSPRKGWYVFRGSSTDSETIVTVKSKAEVVALLADDRLLVTVEGNLYVASPLRVE